MLSYPSGMIRAQPRARPARRRSASAATSGQRAGASCPPAARPCWWWPTLSKGATYADLACGFGAGTSTVYRYIRGALTLLAAMAPTLWSRRSRSRHGRRS